MSTLFASEGVNFFDAFTFEDLCKMRTVSKDVKGSLCGIQLWHAAATRALPAFDLNPAFFLGPALHSCLKVMPFLLQAAFAQHYMVQPSTGARGPHAARAACLVPQDHKIVLRHEVDTITLVERLQQQLEVAKTHLQGGGSFAKVFVAQMGSLIGEHGSVIVLKDCEPTTMVSKAEVGGNGKSAKLCLYLMRQKGKISMAIRRNPKENDGNDGRGVGGVDLVSHVLLDFVGVDASELLVHCRNVYLRINGPWTEAPGLCLVDRPATKTPNLRGMTCLLCLREAPRNLENSETDKRGTARSVEALHIDNVASRRLK